MSYSLKEEFSNSSGCSVSNLKYMRRVYEFYFDALENRQQAVGDLDKICTVPWGIIF